MKLFDALNGVRHADGVFAEGGQFDFWYDPDAPTTLLHDADDAMSRVEELASRGAVWTLDRLQRSVDSRDPAASTSEIIVFGHFFTRRDEGVRTSGVGKGFVDCASGTITRFGIDAW